MILETRFDIGQEVYFLYDQKIKKGVVNHLRIDGIFSDKISPSSEYYTVEYTRDSGEKQRIVLGGQEIFKSPEELVDCLLSEFCSGKN